MVVKLDITGKRFHRLVALNPNGFDKSPSRKHIRWDFICDCGKIYNARINSIVHGATKSCGCLKNEGNANRIHGMTKSREYQSWAHMKGRCLNKLSKDFYLYGGRGILVCDRWVDSFENFYADMGDCPDGFSIDRIDVNGNYEPLNCRWTDSKVQSRNKRDNKFYEFNGMKMCQSDWAKFLGINVSTLIQRLEKWSIERSLSTFKEK